MATFRLILVCALYACMNVAGAALIKRQIARQTLDDAKDFIRLLMAPTVIVGFVFVFVSALVVFKALSMGRLNFVIPVANGINFVLTFAVGLFLFGERIRLVSVCGMALILGGIVLMSFAKD
jgi:multidrug transporter EmrE-like cation transporter